MKYIVALAAIYLTIASMAGVSGAAASGIFTLRGKLKGVSETTFTVQTKAATFDIKKSELSQAQLEELKSKKTGQEVDLIINTEAIAATREVKPVK